METIKIKVKTPKARNPLAVIAFAKSGAGRHNTKKAYNRKQKHRQSWE